MTQSASDKIKTIAMSRGASAAGVVRADDLAEFERFAACAARVPPGLAYLNREPLKRKTIKNWHAAARSVLLCAFRYWTPDMDHAAALKNSGEPAAFLKRTGRKVAQPELLAGPHAKISRYALSRDYHAVVKEKMFSILSAVAEEFPGAEGRVFCDTSPVMEKELARLAGLGFRGKNTLIVSKKLGSYFFLGGLALTLELEPDSPVTDSCGTCSLCQAACPTGALKDGALNAALCLSYWTTQSKEKLPPELALKTAGFSYGCDICQEACPHNKTPGSIAPGFEPIK